MSQLELSKAYFLLCMLFEMSSSRARGLGYFTALGNMSGLSRGHSGTAGFDTGGSLVQPSYNRTIACAVSFWRCEMLYMKVYGVRDCKQAGAASKAKMEHI